MNHVEMLSAMKKSLDRLGVEEIVRRLHASSQNESDLNSVSVREFSRHFELDVMHFYNFIASISCRDDDRFQYIDADFGVRVPKMSGANDDVYQDYFSDADVMFDRAA